MRYRDDDEDIIPLDQKDRDDFTQEEWDEIDRYEFGEEWLDRDEELHNMDIQEYDDMRRIEKYGYLDEEMSCGDEDDG
jgi:hypothetical protein